MCRFNKPIMWMDGPTRDQPDCGFHGELCRDYGGLNFSSCLFSARQFLINVTFEPNLSEIFRRVTTHHFTVFKHDTLFQGTFHWYRLYSFSSY